MHFRNFQEEYFKVCYFKHFVCVCVKANARCVCGGGGSEYNLQELVLSFNLVHPRREPGYQACGKAPLPAGPDKRVFGVCVSMLDAALYSSF